MERSGLIFGYGFIFFCSLRLSVFLPLLLEFQCPNFLDGEKVWKEVVSGCKVAAAKKVCF